MKEGWAGQSGTELQHITNRVTNKERVSTSHIVRNLLKLAEINLINEDFESMMKEPPSVVGVVIHMDPESKDTSQQKLSRGWQP